MKRTLLLTLSATMLSAVTMAQEAKQEKDFNRGWYVGIEAGMPMGESNFSAFGNDKFRPGWNAGLHGGYRFNAILSVEAQAKWGQMFLAEQECCFDRGYWLGSDWNRYHPQLIPDGMEGNYFRDLKSHIFMQQYGVQVNVNVLGFFNRTKDSRWRIELSPAVSAIGTGSDILTKGDEATVREGLDSWHLGIGGNAQVSYAVTKQLNLGVYGGYTHLTGDPMDGLPELHRQDYIINAGLRLSWSFGRRKSEKAQAVAATPIYNKVEEVKETPITTAAPVQEETPAARPTEPKVERVQPQEPQAVEKPEAVVEVHFPVIYFSFNSVWIEPAERAKVKAIADELADTSCRIQVTGWGDKAGGEEVNRRVSLRRAEAVKQALVRRGISADRVETVGGGIKHDAASDQEARCAVTIEVK